nr:chaperone protein dnaj gfa2, mitochondrial [Quercus suber]
MEECTVLTFSENFAELTVILTCAASIVFDWENEGGRKRGVDNDETIKVSRSGGADPDGNQPGDLYIVIKVREDPVFRREGADIHVDAMVRSGTQPGIKTRNTYSFGDQYVHFNVSIPSNLTPRQRELIEEFAKEEQGEYDKRATAGA